MVSQVLWNLLSTTNVNYCIASTAGSIGIRSSRSPPMDTPIISNINLPIISLEADDHDDVFCDKNIPNQNSDQNNTCKDLTLVIT